MCGRYVRRSDKQKIAEHFRAGPSPEMMRAAARAAEDGDLPL